jgi:hypothetical protein
MSPVTKINPQVGRLIAPSELRELQGWLVWRFESEAGTGKQLKVPYWTNGGKRHGKQGGPDDRNRLTTFAAARDAAARRNFEGVGLALMPEFGVTALDFDHCVNADGVLPPEVLDIVSRTYAEYSPSGKGVRAFVKGSLGDHKSTVHQGWPWGFEVFGEHGFVTFTGNALPFTEVLGLDDYIAPVDERVTALCKQRFGAAKAGVSSHDDFMENFEPRLGLTTEDIEVYLSDLDPSVGRDEWIKVGMALHHETGGEGFDLWNDWSSDGHQYPGDEALRLQWDSFDRRDPNARQITMRTVKKMSNDIRSAQGKPPRSFDLINRAAEEARSNAAETNPDRYATPEDWTGKYRVYSGGDFASRPAPKWIIKGVLPEADLGVIFGQSGSGKSFAILDLMLSVCRGVEWRGRKVRQGRVLYVAAEGGGGVSQRLKAYEQHHGLKIADLPLGVVHDAPNLLMEEDVTELVKSIIAAGSGKIIVLDTLAQMTSGGNENSGEDMGLALRHCRAIREATGSMVILVHHSGKDQSKGARGWSGLRGATDVELEVTYEKGDPVRVLRISKQKDGADDLSWAFKLNEVLVGLDDDGDELSSMVVVETEMPKFTPEEDDKDKRKLGTWEKVVMEAISTLEPSVTAISVEALTDLAAETVPPPEEGQRDYRKQNVRRAVTSLSRNPNPLLVIAHGQVEFLAAV